MLRFNRVKGQAIMARTLKNALKAANQYQTFCEFLNRIYREGATLSILMMQTPLFLQALISFVQMNKGVLASGSEDLVLALMLKKDQVAKFPFKRPGTKCLLSFESAEMCFGDLYLHFGDVVVVIVIAA